MIAKHRGGCKPPFFINPISGRTRGARRPNSPNVRFPPRLTTRVGDAVGRGHRRKERGDKRQRVRLSGECHFHFSSSWESCRIFALSHADKNGREWMRRMSDASGVRCFHSRPCQIRKAERMENEKLRASANGRALPATALPNERKRGRAGSQRGGGAPLSGTEAGSRGPAEWRHRPPPARPSAGSPHQQY